MDCHITEFTEKIKQLYVSMVQCFNGLMFFLSSLPKLFLGDILLSVMHDHVFFGFVLFLLNSRSDRYMDI